MKHLDEVEDPELEFTIVELGLVYDIRFEEKLEGIHAEVGILTLTSPGCPAAPEIMAAAHRAALHRRSEKCPHQLGMDAAMGPKIHATEDALMDMGIRD